MFETGQVFHMLRRAGVSVGIAASLGLATGVPSSYASDTLVGRAVLPAVTFADGPTSGQQLGADPINGQNVPFKTNNQCRASRRFAITAMAHFG